MGVVAIYFYTYRLRLLKAVYKQREKSQLNVKEVIKQCEEVVGMN